MIKTLTLTPALLAAIDSVLRAERAYSPGRESASAVEIPKLGLADAVLEAIASQAGGRLAALRELPKARPVPVLELAPRRRRRRRAG